jgi:flagellar hook-associated protein 3 FlgL
LGQATSILNRIRDLTLQASNGSLHEAAKEVIAAELEGLNKDLLARANTQYLGRNIFAGNSDTLGAFTDGGTAHLQHGIRHGETAGRCTTDSARGCRRRRDLRRRRRLGFRPGEQRRDGLRAGANPASRLATIDERIKAAINGRAEGGTRQVQLLEAQDAVDGVKVRKETVPACSWGRQEPAPFLFWIRSESPVRAAR